MKTDRSGDADDASVAMLLTPPQAGAIATIRLMGPAVEAFVAAHLTKAPTLHRATHCELRDGDAVIDDPVAIRLRPDCIELHVHGGPWVMRASLELLERRGFSVIDRQNAPGASWTESDDPIEQQMLQDLPHAPTRQALAVLLAQPEAWQAMLAKRDRDEMRRALADQSLERLLQPPTVAIVGPANVGKSTLANRLFARPLSITADLPGTTRDWVGERANIDGLMITLIDTPGQRRTSDPIEAAAIARAGDPISTADLVILVDDAVQPPSDGIRQLRARYGGAIRVANKCDLSVRPPEADVLPISARTGEGINTLMQRIRDFFGCGSLDSLHARCWTAAQRERLATLV
ncbi:MAG: GTPase [Tepidisphaeraceae bacterium]